MWKFYNIGYHFLWQVYLSINLCQTSCEHTCSSRILPYGGVKSWRQRSPKMFRLCNECSKDISACSENGSITVKFWSHAINITGVTTMENTQDQEVNMLWKIVIKASSAKWFQALRRWGQWIGRSGYVCVGKPKTWEVIALSREVTSAPFLSS